MLRSPPFSCSWAVGATAADYSISDPSLQRSTTCRHMSATRRNVSDSGWNWAAAGFDSVPTCLRLVYNLYTICSLSEVEDEFHLLIKCLDMKGLDIPYTVKPRELSHILMHWTKWINSLPY